MWELEQAVWAQGFGRVAGVDEAGRGPLAGPVVAAAVVLPPHVVIEGLADSKQLAPSQREVVFKRVEERAEDIAVGLVGPADIDRLNILQATLRAMREAVLNLWPAPDFVLVDGNRALPELSYPQQPVVKGDARSASIAAASVVAKVIRDRIMGHLDTLYPGYGFAQHKGYPTPQHRRCLEVLGVSPVHRRSFAPVYRLLGV
ncbi:MAG TPA: ribonuclease HII [Armatimonadetes bacterium]|nr:ribonuclease HII [Armatimonadota bacterium]